MARRRRSMSSVSEAFEHRSNSSNNSVDHANVTIPHVDGRNSSAVNLGRHLRRSARLAQRRRTATTNVIDLGSDPINLDDEVVNGPPLQNTGSGNIPRNIDLNEGGGNDDGEELEEVDESRRSSCKRKAEEEALPANSSSQFVENIAQNASPQGRYNADGAPTEDHPRVNTTPVQMDPRLGSDNHQQDSAPPNLSLTETESVNMRSRHLFMSNGTPVILGERTTAPLEEVDARTIPPAETRNQVQDPRHWSLTNGNMTGIIGSLPQVGSSSAAHPSPAAILMSHQNHHTQNMQMFQEVMHQPPFVTSSESGFGGQINNLFPPINMIYPNGVVQLGHPLPIFPPPQYNYNPHPVPIPISVPQPRARRGSPLDQLIARRLGIPPPAQNTYAFDDGQRRVRNALNIMRMEGAGYENIVFIDQDPSVLFTMGETSDTHRAMRFDVNDMSYENLRNLEEEIGEVHTGLREEVSLKYLKQRIYPALRIAVPSEGEACCICQDEFVNGVQVGELDCGHIYHTVCITEWLKQKNVCPICKTTALVTSGETCSECGSSECSSLHL